MFWNSKPRVVELLSEPLIMVRPKLTNLDSTLFTSPKVKIGLSVSVGSNVKSASACNSPDIPFAVVSL